MGFGDDNNKSAPKQKRKGDEDSVAALTKKPRPLEKDQQMNARKTKDSKTSAPSKSSTSAVISNETPPRAEDQETEDLRHEWKRKVNMMPPSNKLSPSLEENSMASYSYLSVPEVENRMRKDGMERLLISDGEASTVEQRIVYFLYGSGYAWDKPPQQRVDRIQAFLTGAAKNRMLSIIQNDRDHSGNPTLRAVWLENQKSVLRYEQQQNAKTIMSGKRIPYVSHLQSSKNCYLHAASATVGYKVAFGKKESNLKAASVDVSRLVRHSFHDAKLEDRVIHNKGGSSMSLLRELIDGSGCRLQCAVPTRMSVNLATWCIDNHGPALVRRFVVDAFFRNKRSETAGNEDSTEIFIHQFDRVDGKDTHNFLSLGKSTEEELQTIKQIEKANLLPAEDESTDTVSIPSVVASTSTDTTESSSQGILDLAEDDDEETRDGLHAMVAIGYRFEMDGAGQKKYWFLLQNTWRKMPLLEVSAEYLSNHLSLTDGQLVFIDGELEAIPTTLGICRGLYVEASFDDGGEEEEVDDDDLLEEN